MVSNLPAFYFAYMCSYKKCGFLSESKLLKDADTLQSIGLTKGGKLYFKDLGPQVPWTGVRNNY